jgi:hypothetical protein
MPYHGTVLKGGYAIMKPIYYLIIIALIIGAFTMASCEAAPSVLTYNNSVSDTNLYPHQQVNTNIIFNVTADETITTWTWIRDGTNASNNNPTYTTQWTGPGQKNISVFGENINGSTEQISWYPLIEQAMAGSGDVITEINTSAYDSVLEVFTSEDPDYESFLFALTMPLTSILGSLFYVILYGTPFLFMWVGQGSAKIPAVLGCMVSPILLGSFNPDYIGISVLLILLTLFGLIYSMYKERGT